MIAPKKRNKKDYYRKLYLWGKMIMFLIPDETFNDPINKSNDIYMKLGAVSFLNLNLTRNNPLAYQNLFWVAHNKVRIKLYRNKTSYSFIKTNKSSQELVLDFVLKWFVYRETRNSKKRNKTEVKEEI